MKICDILKVDRILPDINSTSKTDVINELIDLLKDDGRVGDIETLRTAVIEREKIMSTGVGKGFAIPHCKTPAVSDIVAGFGKLNNPIDFQSLDKEPVNLVFLLVAKDNMVGPHIKLLSRISRMMNNDKFREDLAKAETAEEIYDIFCEEEKRFV